jgi:hypothetical protein
MRARGAAEQRIARRGPVERPGWVGAAQGVTWSITMLTNPSCPTR